MRTFIRGRSTRPTGPAPTEIGTGGVSTGAPLLVHVPVLLSVEYRLNAAYGREHELQASIAKAVHADVYDGYPDLTLVWHHFGGNIASMLGRTHL